MLASYAPRATLLPFAWTPLTRAQDRKLCMPTANVCICKPARFDKPSRVRVACGMNVAKGGWVGSSATEERQVATQTANLGECV